MPTSPLDPHSASPRELQERIQAERSGVAFLLYRNGGGEQVIIELDPLQASFTIGRRPTNRVSTEWDAEVSRVHAELERVGDDWVVRDDGLSHNGTYVNGERVTGDRRLVDGDTILVGATSIAYRAPQSQSQQSSPTRTAQTPQPGANLTPAQRRVLIALCRPFKDSAYAAPASNQQIADELFVSVDAVKANLRALFEAFDVEGLPQNAKRAALASRALNSGVVNRRDL